MTKRKFNLVILAHTDFPDTIVGIYGDVVGTVQWGLTAIGHDSVISVNKVLPDRTNILFGFHMLTEESLSSMPPNTIVYNMEQLGGQGPLKPSFAFAANRFQIWEYSAGNLDFWIPMKPAKPVVHVPIGWAPILERIPKGVSQDIDALFLGLMTTERLRVFQELGHLRTIFATNVFGAIKDGLIARSKLILNISAYGNPKIFATVRASYAMANAKMVVADRQADSFIEDDLADAVAFTTPTQFKEVCDGLLANEPKRRELEARGQEAMRKRDIRKFLSQVLS
jgi:hypothetical protein